MKPALAQTFVIGRVHRLDFERNLGKIGRNQLHGMLQVVDAGLLGRFPGQQQQMFVPHLFEHLAFFHDLLVGQGDAGELVFMVETAIDAVVGAGVTQIERDIELYRLAEFFLGRGPAQSGHRLQVRPLQGGRADQGLEVLQVYLGTRCLGLGQSSFHIAGGLGVDALACFLPIEIFQYFRKQHFS